LGLRTWSNEEGLEAKGGVRVTPCISQKMAPGEEEEGFSLGTGLF